MYETTYHRPSSVDDAVALFKKGSDSKYLAGGHTLLPVMKQRLAQPSDVIDLARIPALVGVSATADALVIKAATTYYDILTSADAKKAIPAIVHLTSVLGDPAVRYRGTIGGSIANNDPAADYPAALLALGATIVTNKREIAADKFFKGLFETILKDGEIVTAVSFTAPAKAAYQKFRNPASRYAIVGVFVAKGKANGKDEVRVAVTGAGDNGVFRAKAIEAALTKSFDAAAVSGIKLASDNLMTDIHASADYRAHLIGVLAKRAVAAANA